MEGKEEISKEQYGGKPDVPPFPSYSFSLLCNRIIFSYLFNIPLFNSPFLFSLIIIYSFHAIQLRNGTNIVYNGNTSRVKAGFDEPY